VINTLSTVQRCFHMLIICNFVYCVISITNVTGLTLREAGMQELLVNAVMMMYNGAQTVVWTAEGDSSAFDVKVGAVGRYSNVGCSNCTGMNCIIIILNVY